MYRSILGAHASILVSLGLFTALPWVGTMSWTEPTALHRGAISVVLLGTAFDVFRRGERVAHLVILGATFLVLTPTLGTNPVPNDSTAGMTLSAVGIMAARLLPLINALGLVTVLSGVHAVTLGAFRLPEAGLSLDAAVLSLGTAAAAVGFVNAMQASAIDTELMAMVNQERELELARVEAELHARTISRRVLHDDVLGTLHFISDSQASASRTRAQCRSTIAAIRRVVGSAEEPTDDFGEHLERTDLDLPPSIADLVDSLRATAPVPVTVSVVGRSQRLPSLPLDRSDVVLRALSEGVRNAARHGKVEEVTLRISADRRDVRFEVLDRGVGLTTPSAPGFGLLESVERPVSDVGGRAALMPRPGGGAVLVVTIPRGGHRTGGRLHHAHGLTTGGLGSVRTLSRTVAIPLGAAWCVIAVHSVTKTPGSWPHLAVGVAWLVLTVVIVRQAERGSPGAPWVAAVAVAAAAVQVIGIAVLPAGAMLDFRSWSIGMSALPLVVFVLSLPFSVALAVLTSHVLIVLGAAQLRPDLTLGLVPWGSLNAVITCPVPSMVLGSLIRRQGRTLGDQHERELALEHRRAAEEWQAAMTDLYFTHVRLEVLPWLEEIADGSRDPDDPETVTRARLFAVAARDDLYAPGFFDDALRADVAHFRSGGGAVELRAGLVPGGFDRPVGSVLRGLLPVSAGRRIIVSPPVAPERHVRISVVPAPHEGDLERLREGGDRSFESDVDAFRAVLLIDDLPVSG